MATKLIDLAGGLAALTVNAIFSPIGFVAALAFVLSLLAR